VTEANSHREPVAPLLSGVTVRQGGVSYAARFAGRVLADLGAHVCEDTERQESGAGGSTARALDEYLGRGKVAPSAPGEAWDGVIADETSRDAGPGSPVRVTVTPFGGTGPKSGYAATELTMFHASGLGYVTPRAEGDAVAATPPPQPLYCNSHVLSAYVGLHAAASLLAGIYGSRETGRRVEVDLSAQDVILPMLRRETANYQYSGVIANRAAVGGWRVAPAGVRRARDGFLRITIIEDGEWKRFAEAIGRADWLADERFATAESRVLNAAALEADLQAWLDSTTIEDGFLLCQRAGVAIAPANTARSICESAHMKATDYITAGSADGAPLIQSAIKVDGRRMPAQAATPGAAAAAAAAPSARRPSAGRLTEMTVKPLSGVRVLDFGHVWAGPYATQLLAHAGAEVIKVESARHIDVHRRMPPFSGGTPDIDRAGVWNAQNSGKRSVTLNLATPEGVALAKALVRESDIGIDNYAPGVMDRLGLGWDELHRTNPRYIHASITGFGRTGPYRTFKSYGPTIEACGGLSSLTGYSGGIPRSMGGGFPDTSSAVYAAIGAISGLVARERTGIGCHVEVNQFEATVSLIPEAILTWLIEQRDSLPKGNKHEQHVPHDVYPCAGEDQWVAIACRSDGQWRALCRALSGLITSQGGDAAALSELEPLTQAERLARQPAIDDVITSFTRQLPAYEVEVALQSTGVPASVCMSVMNLLEDEHLAERHAFVKVNHPASGEEILYRQTWEFVGADPAAPAPAPCLGQDNDMVFQQILGLSTEEIADLIGRQVVY
jgi:crotonobetainyl-CoA:carnitine CoA-transferase CaiB-like acyl-CoA transferase